MNPLILSLGLATTLLTAQAASILLKDGWIFTASGPVLTNASVLIRDGRIQKVGAGLTDKADTVVELGGQRVFPGLIAPTTVLGLLEIDALRATRDTTEVGEYSADVSAWIAVNPDSELIPVARANGYTHAQVVPPLGQIRLDALSGTMLRGELPVTVVASGSTDTVVVDQPRARAVVERMFPTDLLTTGQTPLPRVVLEAAGASAGYVLKVRRQLTDSGVAVIDGGVSAAPLRVSRVLLNAAVPRSRDLGFSIADSLGLPEWAVQASTDSPVDVILRLGADEGLQP